MTNKKVFDELCRMAYTLTKQFDREVFDAMCDLAYENDINICWDDDYIAVEDEMFYLGYKFYEC